MSTRSTSLPFWTLALLVPALAGCDGDEVSGPGDADHLAFTVEPHSAGIGNPISPPVVVTIRDKDGQPVWTWAESVTLSLQGGPGDIPLQGTTVASPLGGTARFDNLFLPKAGGGYQIVASSGSLEEAVSQPFSVYGEFRAAAVSAGQFHTCALDEDGLAYCWGSNAEGQLGNGTTTDHPLPARVDTPLRFQTLSAGASHSCGLTDDGEAYCWGSNVDGALGAPASEDCQVTSSGYSVPCSTSPLNVSGGFLWRAISAGASHTCGLTAEGKMYCWGGNGAGQLGIGLDEDRTAPTPVSGDAHFMQMSAGYVHSCGLTVEGQAFCWGSNFYGEVGDSTGTKQTVPTPVHGDLRFSSIDAGGSGCHGQTCGITLDGATYCWGKNYQRYLNGSEHILVYSPLPVVEDPGFETVVVGGTLVCGLKSDGTLHCWGDGYDGQLGNGGTHRQSHPTAVRPDLSFSSVSSGWYHTCGATVEGTTYCWGRNTSGQLGNQSNSVGWTVPVPVWGDG